MAALQFCVVCGRGSTRASWPQSGAINGVSFVACDFHSQAAIASAVVDFGAYAAGLQVFPAQLRIRKTIHEPQGA